VADLRRIRIEIAESGWRAPSLKLLPHGAPSWVAKTSGPCALIDYLADEFKKETAVDRTPIAGTQRLEEAAEKSQDRAVFQQARNRRATAVHHRLIPQVPSHLHGKVTRAKLESLVEELISSAHRALRVAMKDAVLDVSRSTKLILVGGSDPYAGWCRKNRADCFGKEPRKDVNPDEAVCRRPLRFKVAGSGW